MHHSPFELALVVSLPDNLERRQYVSNVMAREEIPFEFVDAIRARVEDVRYSDIREMDFYNGRWEYFRNPGYICAVIGCRQSHVKALRLAKERGVSSVAIFEDDITFAPNWRKILASAQRDLPARWLQLYLGGQLFGRAMTISPHLVKADKVWANHAILYHADAFDLAIAALETVPAEADVALAKGLQNLGRTYVISPMIAAQERFKSQIT